MSTEGELVGPWPNGGSLDDARTPGFTGPEFFRTVIRRKDFAWSEEFMRAVLSAPRSDMETYWALLALSELGSLASVPDLKALLTHKKQDIKIVALNTIAHLAGNKETALYVDCLTGGLYRQPWAAMHSIQVTADPSALPAVLAWLRKNRSALRTGTIDGQLAFELATYLYRLREVPEAAAAFEEVRGDVWKAWRAKGLQGYRGYEPVLAALQRD